MTGDHARYGRMGGLTTQGTHDPTENTRPAREAFLLRFERMADPDGILPPPERERRARRLLRAHMVKLSLASAAARRKAAR
jgi:hypothetical protein